MPEKGNNILKDNQDNCFRYLCGHRIAASKKLRV